MLFQFWPGSLGLSGPDIFSVYSVTLYYSYLFGLFICYYSHCCYCHLLVVVTYIIVVIIIIVISSYLPVVVLFYLLIVIAFVAMLTLYQTILLRYLPFANHVSSEAALAAEEKELWVPQETERRVS